MRNRKLSNERGATAIEYGLIAALIAIIIIPAVSSLGGNTNSMWVIVSNKVSNAIDGAVSR